MDPRLVGRSYRGEPYLVSREKIREFAVAIGEIPSDIAPPTFAFVLVLPVMEAAMSDPELGLRYDRAVHGRQRFEYARPIVAGDELTATCAIADIAVRGRHEVLTLRTELRGRAGELVVATEEVVVTRDTAP